MSRLLALETSGPEAGLAVWLDGNVREARFAHLQQLSRDLAPRIEALLAEAGLAPGDLEAVAVSIGPGSFTGLRIGVATAKGLAYALGVPAVPISTLEALAAEHEAPPDVLVCPVINASAADLFAALYQWQDGRLETRAQELLWPALDLAKLLAASPLRTLVAGDPGPHREALTECLGGRGSFVGGRAGPLAATVARLAVAELERGGGVDPHDLAPRYLRASTPEVRLGLR